MNHQNVITTLITVIKILQYCLVFSKTYKNNFVERNNSLFLYRGIFYLLHLFHRMTLLKYRFSLCVFSQNFLEYYLTKHQIMTRQKFSKRAIYIVQGLFNHIIAYIILLPVIN